MISGLLVSFLLLCSYFAIFIFGGILGMSIGYGGGYEQCLEDLKPKKKCKNK